MGEIHERLNHIISRGDSLTPADTRRSDSEQQARITIAGQHLDRLIAQRDAWQDTAELAETRLNDMVKQRNDWRYLALHDEMTGCLNRRGLFNEADTNSYRYCYMIDVDGLKVINDTVSHAAGDIHIKTVVTILNEIAQTGNGIVARVGGDEFILLMHDMVYIAQNDMFSHGWVEISRYGDLDQAINRADARMMTRKRQRKLEN